MQNAHAVVAKNINIVTVWLCQKLAEMTHVLVAAAKNISTVTVPFSKNSNSAEDDFCAMALCKVVLETNISHVNEFFAAHFFYFVSTHCGKLKKGIFNGFANRLHGFSMIPMRTTNGFGNHFINHLQFK